MDKETVVNSETAKQCKTSDIGIAEAIITNPFKDIVPRKLEKRREKTEEKKESKARATKAFNLLSFGEEEEEAEELALAAPRKPKSAHDVLDDEALSAVAAVDPGELGNRGPDEQELEKARLDRLEKVKAKLADAQAPKKRRRKAEGGEDRDLDDLLAESEREKGEAAKSAIRDEIRQLQKEIARARRGPSAEKEEEAEPESEAMASYHSTMRKYEDATKKLPKPKTSTREEQTMAMLAKFKRKLNEEKEKPKEEDPHIVEMEQRLKELRDELGEEYQEEVKEEEEALFGDDWMANKFETDVEELRRAKDVNVEDLNSYSIHDRRNPINVRRRAGLDAANEATSARLKELEKYA